MSVKFSIVIPVYNVAPYLRECLDSVLAQTFMDWEAICVDDGSTDDSLKILERYVSRDKRFKVFHQENAGVSAARNFALSQAEGEWICFLDGDDVVLCDWLEHVHRASVTSVEAQWIRTGFVDWYVDRNVKRVVSGVPIVIFGDEVRSRGEQFLVWQGLMWLNFYKREIISAVRFCPNVRIREDSLFALEAMARVKCLKVIESADYLYRHTMCSSSQQSFSKMEVAPFHFALERLWQEGKITNNCFTLLSYKNSIWWLGKVKNPTSEVIRELRNLIRQSQDFGSFRFSKLPFVTRVRFWLFVQLGVQFVLAINRDCIKRFLSKKGLT